MYDGLLYIMLNVPTRLRDSMRKYFFLSSLQELKKIDERLERNSLARQFIATGTTF